MKRRHVSSRAVSSIGYDPAKKLLEVEFIEGRVYQYGGVAPGEYVGLVTAESIGTYMNKRIKPRHPNFWEV